MKRASFEFILCSVALLAGSATCSALAQMELATTKPGPHALIASLRTPEPTTIPYIWQGDTNIILLSTTWQLIELPAKADNLEPAILRLLAPQSPTADPQMFLYSQGDPIHLSRSSGQWGFRGYAPETGQAESQSIPLPDLRGADIILLHDQQVVGVRTWEALLTKKEIETGISLSRSPNGTHQAHVSTANMTQPASITLQPIYRERTAYPSQSGIYLFQAFDHQHNRIQNTGRRLQAGRPTGISLNEGGFTGECLQFLPEQIPYSSNLEQDHVVRFDGFHKRERTRDPAAPLGRWTSRPDARIDVIHPPGTDLSVTLCFLANRPDHIPLPAIFLDAQENQYVLDMQAGESSITINIPPHDKETTTFTINTETWRPAQVIGSGDNRTLGVMLTGLRVAFHPPGATAAAPPNQP
jgi:hypothetical protein